MINPGSMQLGLQLERITSNAYSKIAKEVFVCLATEFSTFKDKFHPNWGKMNKENYKNAMDKLGLSYETGKLDKKTGKFLKALFILTIAGTVAGAADIVVDFAAGEFPVGKLT